MAPSVQELQQQMRQKETWLAWFAAHREYLSMANRVELDSWLTEHGKSLTIPEIDAALEALIPTGRLCVNRPEDYPRRNVEETPAETPTASAGDTGDQLPPNMPSRKELRAMSGVDFMKACKKYGEQNCLKVYHSARS